MKLILQFLDQNVYLYKFTWSIPDMIISTIFMDNLLIR